MKWKKTNLICESLYMKHLNHKLDCKFLKSLRDSCWWWVDFQWQKISTKKNKQKVSISDARAPWKQAFVIRKSVNFNNMSLEKGKLKTYEKELDQREIIYGTKSLKNNNVTVQKTTTLFVNEHVAFQDKEEVVWDNWSWNIWCFCWSWG